MPLSQAHLEKELKFRLTGPEHARLLYLLSSLDPEVQSLTTTYFDTPSGQLRQQGAALRLRSRTKGHSLELKVAKTAPKASALLQHVEYEASVPEDRARELRAGRLAPLSLRNRVARQAATYFEEAPPRLAVLGTLRTRRVRVELDELTLDLDRVSIGKQTFYELEIETEEEKNAQEWVESVFGLLKIKIRPSRVPKISHVWALWRKKKKAGRTNTIRRPAQK